MAAVRTMAAFVLAAATAWAQPVESLVVDWLSSAEEAQFSEVDGGLSQFWTNWTGKDSLGLDVANYSYTGKDTWDSPTDAQVVVKAAGGAGGLYLLIRVADDRWVDTASGVFFGDMIRLFLDSMPAAEIATCTDCLVGLYNTRLTYMSEMMYVWVGTSDSSISSVEYWACEVDNLGAFRYADLTVAELLQYFGIRLESAPWAQHARTVEMQIPWAVFQHMRFGMTPEQLADGIVPARGSRMAMALTYHDFDSVGQSESALTWTGVDPWAGGDSCWGDLVFGEGFPVEPVPVESLSVHDHAAVRVAGPARAGISTQHFDLLGRMVLEPRQHWGVAMSAEGIVCGRMTR